MKNINVSLSSNTTIKKNLDLAKVKWILIKEYEFMLFVTILVEKNIWAKHVGILGLRLKRVIETFDIINK